MKKLLLLAFIAFSFNAFAQSKQALQQQQQTGTSLMDQTQIQHQLWGMTSHGGANLDGVIFKTDHSGNNEMVKKNFLPILANNDNPNGSLMQATDKKLYGMTRYGGLNDEGVLFQYDAPTSTYVVKVNFEGASNGRYFDGSLIQATDGKIYGMTWAGGVNDLGVLFQFDPVTGIYTKKVDFAGASNGAGPYGALMQATDGKLYGMTSWGGANDLGVLFQFNPSTGTLIKKVDFAEISNGSSPYGSLVQAADGKLYGMTTTGGLYSEGVLFQFDPVSSVFTKKLDFDGPVNGGEPYGSLIKATDNKLYGFTSNGGDHSNGVLFQFDPATSVFTKKLDFYGAETGSYPYGSFVQASDGYLYAMTSEGGANDFGVIFQFDPATSSYVKKLDFDGVNGNNPVYTNLIEIPVTISTLAVSMTNCVGTSVNVPFSIEGAYDPGNIFAVQLSDASGSFASPVIIGSSTSTNAGSISCVIPSVTLPGNGYRIRVMGSNPDVTGSDNGSNITINALPNVATTISGTTITANQTGASYQWLNCLTGNSVINGATGISFTATANGSYAVMITMPGNGCIVTSACVSVINVGIDEIAARNQLTVYPNPGNGKFTVSSQNTISEIEVYDLFGVRLFYADYNLKQQTSNEIDLTGFANGVYIMKVHNGTKVYTTKVIIQ